MEYQNAKSNCLLLSPLNIYLLKETYGLSTRRKKFQKKRKKKRKVSFPELIKSLQKNK